MSQEDSYDTGSRTESDGDEALPEEVDEAAVARMRAVVRILDDSVRVPGTDFRVGLDPVLGALPGAGDAISAGLSLYVVAESARLGVPYLTLVRMLANVAIDVVGGSIPVVGVLFDAVWKANKRNVELALEELAADREPRVEADATSIDID